MERAFPNARSNLEHMGSFTLSKICGRNVDGHCVKIARSEPNAQDDLFEVEAARGADLIVLAVPIQTMRATLENMIEHTAPDAVVTDVGSVKQYVVRELEPLITGKRSLVAAHPVAGKETTGAAAADPAGRTAGSGPRAGRRPPPASGPGRAPARRSARAGPTWSSTGSASSYFCASWSAASQR